MGGCLHIWGEEEKKKSDAMVFRENSPGYPSPIEMQTTSRVFVRVGGFFFSVSIPSSENDVAGFYPRRSAITRAVFRQNLLPSDLLQ